METCRRKVEYREMTYAGMRFTEQEIAEMMARRGKPYPVQPPKPSKYHAVLCEADGIKFSSKKERRRYLELVTLQHAGAVSYFLRQVPFDLPGGTKYRLDFLVFWQDGKVTHEDTKGVRTAMFILKKKQVESIYPVKILEA
jgi:hypothetical protein